MDKFDNTGDIPSNSPKEGNSPQAEDTSSPEAIAKQVHVIAANLLLEGHFRFKTFQEAMILSEFISEVCPNKMLSHMGLAELFTNAVEHGNLGISSEEKTNLQKNGRWMEEIDRRLALPENLGKWVEVFMSRKDHELHVKVIDEGMGFDWQKYQAKTEDLNLDSHGRGIAMAKDLAFKKLLYSGRGNVVECIIELGQASQR